MVKFDEIISASLEWTTTVLFRPFSPKKWLILTFIALLAGSLAGGSNNFNFRGSGRDYRSKEASAAPQHEKSSFQVASVNHPDGKLPSKQEIKRFLKEQTLAPSIFIIALAASAGIAVFLVLLWLCSRFYFIFLEDVVKNDASIAASFKNNKEIGNSFFRFNILWTFLFVCAIGLIVFLGFISLSKIGAFNSQQHVGFWKILSALTPAILLFVFTILVSLLFALIVNDFAIIVMFKDRIKTIAAIKKVFSVLSLNKANFILYVLIKMGLAIVSSIIYTIASFVAMMGLVFPVGIISGISYFIYKAIPKGVQPVVMISGILAAIPLVLFLWYCLMSLFLPFAVFFRTFSVKFFGRLDGRYNLFRYTDDRR